MFSSHAWGIYFSYGNTEMEKDVRLLFIQKTAFCQQPPFLSAALGKASVQPLLQPQLSISPPLKIFPQNTDMRARKSFCFCFTFLSCQIQGHCSDLTLDLKIRIDINLRLISGAHYTPLFPVCPFPIKRTLGSSSSGASPTNFNRQAETKELTPEQRGKWNRKRN